MIVLDEQLLGRGIEEVIRRWYPGAVCFINDLRPGTVIKDEAIPMLLSQEAEPTFVTINETDFWNRVAISDRFCIVCMALTDSRVADIPALLQRLLRHPDFSTKARRMGCVIRLTSTNAAYYTVQDKTAIPIEKWHE
jgi:hypothetical protein